MRAPTADQLRQDIDRGATSSDVPVSDPAAAPLGKDQVVAGARVPPDADAKGRAEGSPGPSTSGQDTIDADRDGPRAVFAAVLAAAVIALMLMLVLLATGH